MKKIALITSIFLLCCFLFKDFFIPKITDTSSKEPLASEDNKQEDENIKLIMTLVVKNEEEIIEQNIRFHHAMGVDGFIVSSHNSTDNTDNILEKLKQEGIVLEIIKRTSPDHKHAVWAKEMIEIARDKYHANWVMHADADEFYYSNSLDLKKSIKENEGVNVLLINSIFLYPEDRDDYLNSSFFVTRPFQKFEAEVLGITDNPLFSSFIGQQNCKKVIHKTEGFKDIFHGNHDVDMINKKTVSPENIRLYHYHIRNYKAWEEKIMRWVDSVNYFPLGFAQHMKNMVELYETGKLREEFDKLYNQEMLDFLMSQGVVTYDPSVKNFLHYKGII